MADFVRVSINGCDDTTIVDLDGVSLDGLALLNRLAELSAAKATQVCMPTITIVSADEALTEDHESALRENKYER